MLRRRNELIFVVGGAGDRLGLDCRLGGGGWVSRGRRDTNSGVGVAMDEN